jgi:hypothetical protein
MKNTSQWRFNMSAPNRDVACEKCVYGSGEHAKWCPEKPKGAPKNKAAK